MLVIMRLLIKYREVIYLFYYEELMIKDIVLIIRIGINIVKMRLRCVKLFLKEMLEE